MGTSRGEHHQECRAAVEPATATAGDRARPWNAVVDAFLRVALPLAVALVVAVTLTGAAGTTDRAAAASPPVPTVVDRVFSPPATIASDCSVDVADPLRAWLYSLPAGRPAASR